MINMLLSNKYTFKYTFKKGVAKVLLHFLKLDSINLLHFFTFDTLLKKLYQSFAPLFSFDTNFCSTFLHLIQSFAPLFLKVDKVEIKSSNKLYFNNISYAYWKKLVEFSLCKFRLYNICYNCILLFKN
jgi:hypothetical protein